MAGKRKDSKGRILRKGESQRKSGTYDYRWTDKNRKQHSVYAKTLDELREKEAKIQRDISDGIDYTAGEKTVSELVDKYISFKRNARTNTLRAYSSVVNRIHTSDFGKRRIKDVKKSDAQAWFVELHDSGLKRNTISVIKTCFSQRLRWQSMMTLSEKIRLGLIYLTCCQMTSKSELP